MPRRDFLESRQDFLKETKAEPQTQKASVFDVFSQLKSADDLVQMLEKLVNLRHTTAHTHPELQAGINSRIRAICDFIRYHYQDASDAIFEQEIWARIKDSRVPALQEVKRLLEPLKAEQQAQCQAFTESVAVLRRHLEDDKQVAAVDEYTKAHDDFYLKSVFFYLATSNRHLAPDETPQEFLGGERVPEYEEASRHLNEAMDALRALDSHAFHLSLILKKIEEDLAAGILRHDLMVKAQEVRQYHVDHPAQTKLLPSQDFIYKDIADIAAQYLRDPTTESFQLSEDDHCLAFEERRLAPLLYSLLANPVLSHLKVPLVITRVSDLEYLCAILKLNTSLIDFEIKFDPAIQERCLEKLAEVFQFNTTLQQLNVVDDSQLNALLARNRVLVEIQNSYADRKHAGLPASLDEVEAMLKKIDDLYWDHRGFFQQRDPHLSQVQCALIYKYIRLKLNSTANMRQDIIKSFTFLMSLQPDCVKAKFDEKFHAFCQLLSARAPLTLYDLLFQIPKGHPYHQAAQGYMAQLVINPGPDESEADRLKRLERVVAHYDAAGDEEQKAVFLRVRCGQNPLLRHQEPQVQETPEQKLRNAVLAKIKQENKVCEDKPLQQAPLTWTKREVRVRFWAVFFRPPAAQSEPLSDRIAKPSILATLS